MKLDAATGRVDGRAGDGGLLLQPEREENMRGDLVLFGLDRFHLEGEVQDAANGFWAEDDRLTHGGRTVRIKTYHPDIGPLVIAFPLDEVRPDQLYGSRDDGDGTNRQTHSEFFFSVSKGH